VIRRRIALSLLLVLVTVLGLPLGTWLARRRALAFVIPLLDGGGAGAVVVTLSPDDLPPLGDQHDGCAVKSFQEDARSWRCLHGRLLDRLALAGASVVAFDIEFSSGAGHEAQLDEATAELLSAIRRVTRGLGPEGEHLRESVHVVLGVDEQLPLGPLYAESGAQAGSFGGLVDPYWSYVTRIALVEELDGEWIPGLAMQALSLARYGHPAEVLAGHVAKPTGLPAVDTMTLRFMEKAPEIRDYHWVLDHDVSIEDLRDVVQDKVVFVGVIGDWGGGDAYEVPFRTGGLPVAKDGEYSTYGVFMHLHAFNQLDSNAALRGGGPWADLLSGVIAVLVALVPGLILWRHARPGGFLRLPGHRQIDIPWWPMPALAGAFAVFLLALLSFRLDVEFHPAVPLVGAMWAVLIMGYRGFAGHRERLTGREEPQQGSEAPSRSPRPKHLDEEDPRKAPKTVEDSMSDIVLISYSHDSPSHAAKVKHLADKLRHHGVDVRIDQYVPAAGPPEGWPMWMTRMVKSARHIIVVCTETYTRRFEGNEDPGTGRGVTWEGLMLQQVLYESQSRNHRLIPVVFDGETESSVPLILRPFRRFDLPSEYRKLYAALTGQALTDVPEVGTRIEAPSAPPQALDPAWLDIGSELDEEFE